MLSGIYGITDMGLLAGIRHHSGDVKFVDNVIDDGTPVLVDNPTMLIPSHIRQFNTSDLSRLLAIDEGSQRSFSEAFNCSGKPSAMSFFTMIRENGEFLVPVAIGYSGRFMNGNVGPDVGFMHGVGFMVENPKHWVTSMGEVLDYLSGKYAGEIAIDVDEDWCISRIRFGHQPQYLSLLCEFYGMRYDELLDWLVNEEDSPRHSVGVAISVAVSKPPFPVVEVEQRDGIQAANEAEKHIRRVLMGRCEIALVTAHSEGVPLGRRRVFRTINRMRRYDERIQYRTDCGYKLNFGELTGAYEGYCREKSPHCVDAVRAERISI